MKLRGKLKQKRRKEQQAARWAKRPPKPIRRLDDQCDPIFGTVMAMVAASAIAKKAREARDDV